MQALWLAKKGEHFIEKMKTLVRQVQDKIAFKGTKSLFLQLVSEDQFLGKLCMWSSVQPPQIIMAVIIKPE